LVGKANKFVGWLIQIAATMVPQIDIGNLSHILAIEKIFTIGYHQSSQQR
jgi:hypothetical protein